MNVPLELIKEYNRKRDIKEYLIGIKDNIGSDIRLSELISKINMELIVIEKKISNNTIEQ